MITVPFILGGHTFIQQLGNEPPLTPDGQTELVAACLDAGIAWFDTTYLPERVALGAALARLGRRSEAKIVAWNFFHPFGPGEEVGGASTYRPEHLRQMQDELQTDYIDGLVIHGAGDAAEDRRQLELVQRWQAEGNVGELGLWHPGPDVAERFAPARAGELFARGETKEAAPAFQPAQSGQDGQAGKPGTPREANPYRFMVRPYNVTTADASAAFAAAKAIGWHTLAASPFVRGWEIDKRVEKLVAQERIGADEARRRLADAMLRYTLFAPNVDRAIVALRRVEWVRANVESWRRGPLSADEREWLAKMAC